MQTTRQEPRTAWAWEQPPSRPPAARGGRAATAAGRAGRRRETPVGQFGTALGLFGLTIASVVLISLFTIFGSLITIGVGIPVTIALAMAVRGHADLHRLWAARRLGVTVRRPYRPAPPGGLLAKLGGVLRDPATWRDYAWLWVNATAGMTLTTLAFSLWLHVAWCFALPLIWVLYPGTRDVLDLFDLIDGTSRVSYLLAPAVGVLTAVLAGRWVPRILDAHAQVSLWLLAPVEDTWPGQPAPAVSPAAPDSGAGLAGMIQRHAAGLPVPVDVHGTLPRLSADLEARLHSAVVEALGNVVAHSQAERAWVDLRAGDGRVQVTVGDNGVGGAVVTDAGGLRAAERLLSAAGGLLAVSSPVGGPTIVTMEILDPTQ
jgi:hypothetical protein